MSDLVVSESGEILDEQVLGKPPSNTLAVVESGIIPYFPDDERKQRYLVYISSGFTSREAMIRCKDESGHSLVKEDIDYWRNTDDKFRELVDAGYGALREATANAYMELMLRRDTVGILEVNRKIVDIVLDKVTNGEDLTKDEKFIYDKASKIYTPENIQKMVKLVHGDDSGDEKPHGQVLDFVAIVKGRMTT